MAVTPDVAAAYERDALAGIALNRTRYENTGNPLYVWRTIGVCFAIAEMWRRAQGFHISPPGDEPFPLPRWCLEYLGIVAVRMDALSEGKDFRLVGKPFGNASTPADPQPSLNSPQSAALVNAALGLVRPGWNSFDRLRDLEAKEQDDFAEEALRYEGKSAFEAMGASDRSLQGVIGKLEAGGYIACDRHHTRTTHYRLLVPAQANRRRCS